LINNYIGDKNHLYYLVNDTIDKIIRDEKISYIEVEEDHFLDVINLKTDSVASWFYNYVVKKINLPTKITTENFKFFSDCDKVYYALRDKKSRDVFDWYFKSIVARIMLRNLKDAERIVPYDFLDKNMAYSVKSFLKQAIPISGEEFKISNYTIKTNAPSLLETWTCETYLLEDICTVKKGDVIIDGGAYKGETALWFAKKTEEYCEIHAFEAVYEFAKVMQENIVNNNLQDKIYVQAKGLWNEETKLGMFLQDSVSECLTESLENQIETTTIDIYIKSNNIKKVDFIKLDVEASELMAILGAKETIAKFAPKMAICIYHRLDHIYEIPNLVLSIYPHYDIYLSHKTYGPMNTIMYFVPKN